jgi:toxin ParE1/3/4
MARIEAAPEVFDDFDRFFEHLIQFEVDDVPGRLAEILQAVEVLATSPVAGRTDMLRCIGT